MKKWTFWEWLSYATLWIAALVIALDTSLKLTSGLLRQEVTGLLESPVWGFSPLALVIVGTVIFILRQLGWINHVQLTLGDAAEPPQVSHAHPAQIRPHTTAKSPLSWDFDKPNHYFLGLTGGNDSVVVPAFQASCHNNLGRPIRQISGRLQIDRTGKQYPIFLNVGGQPVKPETTNGVPKDADFSIVVPFYTTNRYEEYIPILRFLAEFPPFTLLVEYDGAIFEKTFTRRDVKDQIFAFLDAIAERNMPVVTLK